MADFWSRSCIKLSQKSYLRKVISEKLSQIKLRDHGNCYETRFGGHLGTVWYSRRHRLGFFRVSMDLVFGMYGLGIGNGYVR